MSVTDDFRVYGFDGPVDYIERITYNIWNLPDRDSSLVRSYYTPDTAIHLDGGDLVGGDQVVTNTDARLASFPDFHGTIDDTIWTGPEEGLYRTSMRWSWVGTDSGGTVFGDATGRPVHVVSIANCVVSGEHIVEEWLGTNPMSVARQLGHSLDTAMTATTYPAYPKIAPAPFGRRANAAGDVVGTALEGVLTGALPARLFRADCSSLFAGEGGVVGIGAVESWAQRLRTELGTLRLTVDDQYSLPGSDDRGERVATQARVAGIGPAGPVEFSLIAHHHVVEGRIAAQWVLYDELALAHHRVVLTD